MRILVTDGMDKTAMAKLREMGHEVVEQFYESDELGKALRDFDVAVVRSKTKVRANHIDEAKGGKLKMVIRGGVGVDNIDVKYAEDNGITVKNTPRASSESVAELAMAHMFSCARFISHAGYTMRNDKWEKKAYGKGIELCGKTLGIIGFGRIGQKLGVMAKAIGMNVVAFDIFHIPGIEEQLGIPYVEMDELLAQADFISVHAPAVDGGAIINAETISKMRTAFASSTPPAAPTSTRLPCSPVSRAARSALPVWTCTLTSPPPTRRSTAIPWFPARRTSAPPPWRPRSASAWRSSTSSPRCNSFFQKRDSKRCPSFSSCLCRRKVVSPSGTGKGVSRFGASDFSAPPEKSPKGRPEALRPGTPLNGHARLNFCAQFWNR